MMTKDDALTEIVAILQNNHNFEYLYNYSFKQVDVFASGNGTIKDNFGRIKLYAENFMPEFWQDYVADAGSDHDFCVGMANATIALTFLACMVDKLLDYLSTNKISIYGFTYARSTKAKEFNAILFGYDELIFDLIQRNNERKRIRITLNLYELHRDIIDSGIGLEDVLRDYTGVFTYTLSSTISGTKKITKVSRPFNTISATFAQELKQSIKEFLDSNPTLY